MITYYVAGRITPDLSSGLSPLLLATMALGTRLIFFFPQACGVACLQCTQSFPEYLFSVHPRQHPALIPACAQCLGKLGLNLSDIVASTAATEYVSTDKVEAHTHYLLILLSLPPSFK